MAARESETSQLISQFCCCSYSGSVTVERVISVAVTLDGGVYTEQTNLAFS